MFSDIDIATGSNCASFTDIAGNDYWFSYRTLVAFQRNGERIVRRNDWGPTTGKQLNAIDGGSKEARDARLDGDAFKAAVERLVLSNSPV
tara:strand:- start:208 stop:477 length:270 start_codon:yes stop_codon:yes gene_type:complete